MTFVVRRPKGRWEVRESIREPTVSVRSLASFTVLDEQVLAKARARARTPFDDEEVLEAARRVGAPIAPRRADLLVKDLLVELDEGRPPRLGFEALVRSFTSGDPETSHLREAEEWVGRSMELRGEALVGLLRYVDALPWIHRIPGKPRFPRLEPRS